MKKTIKRHIIIILILIIIIITPVLICFIPTKKISMKIDLKEGSFQELVVNEEAQIYVTHHPEFPCWRIYGANGIRFKSGSEFTVIVGNFPKEINIDLIGNIFVLNGKYIGMKKLKDVGKPSGYRCFYVDSWGILGDVERRDVDFLKYLSKSSLTVADELFAESVNELELDDLEDVEDTDEINN